MSGLLLAQLDELSSNGLTYISLRSLVKYRRNATIRATFARLDRHDLELGETPISGIRTVPHSSQGREIKHRFQFRIISVDTRHWKTGIPSRGADDPRDAFAEALLDALGREEPSAPTPATKKGS